MSWSTDNLTTDQRAQIARDSFQVKEVRGDELHGLCPVHEDHNASFSYNIAKDACNCLACGFKGDLIALWGKTNGIGDNSEAFKAFRDRFGDGILTRPFASGKRGPSTGQAGGAGKSEIKAEVEVTTVIPESDWEKLPPLPENWRKRCREKFGWSEDIIDCFGLRLRQVGDETRIAIPIRNDQGQLVNIRLYLPGAAENKLISWGKGFGKGKLFPAPPLPDDDPVIICEGEKDTLTALSHGFNAITQTCGVNSWSDKYNRFFQDHKVVIAYDNDDAGRKGAEKVAKQLAGTAASVWIIQWPPVMQDKQDVCDWFTTHGKTAEEFRDLILDAKQVAKSGKTGRSRAERAEEIPEEQRLFFVGKQFKPRLCADVVLHERKLGHDPRTGQVYQWNGKHWEEIHEATIRYHVLTLLGQEAKTSMVTDVVKIVCDLSIIRNGRAYNDKSGMLPLQNGMLDLDARSIQPHHLDNLNTYCLDISLRTDPADLPQCPVFRQFMLDFIPDDAARREVIKFMAYCLTRETRHEKALFLIGPGGDGKSTFIRIMEAILGEINVSNISLGALEDQFQRVMLKDKLLNVSTEIEGDLIQTGMFKAVVSGDRISASYKHRDGFSFKPVAKHIFAANKFPAIKDTSRGLLRRMIIVETARSFAKPDLSLTEKLLAELDGIFLMLVVHLKHLQDEGFQDENIPWLMASRARFAESSNPVIGFVNYCIDIREGSQVDTMTVYEKYVKYCSRRGYKPKSEQHFGKEIKAIIPAIDRKREGGGARKYLYHGIDIDFTAE